MKLPTKSEAQKLLAEAEIMNPGPWAAHSRVAADCARIIAEKCDHLDSDTAYVLGLLHDVGRREGVTDMRHIFDGYGYLKSLGYDDAARICLTHSFPYKDVRSYNGQNDCTSEETEFIKTFIANTEYDDYDRLIQLCDALALPDGATLIEKRLADVVKRRGANALTEVKHRSFSALKTYFDTKTGTDIYRLLTLI